MSDPKPAASLSPTLLARKGAAKPAMRPQLQPLHQFQEATARDMAMEDLGWNDHGEDLPHAGGEVVPINGEGSVLFSSPEVRKQQASLTDHLTRQPVQRQSALDRGRRAAFTLRVDAERHLRLRLASTVTNRSAQQIVTEALDRFLAEMPEIETLASKVRESR